MHAPRENPYPAGLIVGLVVGSLVLGALCGGVGTYGVLSVQKSISRSTVPTPEGFGKPSVSPLEEGWWKHSFSELDLSLELPGNAVPTRRDWREGHETGISETADYVVSSTSAMIELGAYWMTDQPGDNLEDLMEYNLQDPERATQPGFRIERLMIDGHPAVLSEGTAMSEGRKSYFHILYIQRGNGLYYLQSSYWLQNQPEAQDEWKRMLKSLRFDNKKPLVR